MSLQQTPQPFETTKNDQNFARLTPDARRLFWSLDSINLGDAIWVMEGDYIPDSLEPYRLQTEAGEQIATEAWHAVSHSPLTEPKVSSITVRVQDLEMWEEEWLDFHRDHCEMPNANEGNLEEVIHRDGADESIATRWGVLPDYDPDEDEEGPLHLLVCCGETRPLNKKAYIVVKPSGGKKFVTVHDYVTTVHPWLFTRAGDVRAAMGLWDEAPLPAEKRLMVNYSAPDSLKVYEREEWIEMERKRPTPAFLEALRAQQAGENISLWFTP